MKLGIFTLYLCNNGKEMYKKSDIYAELLFVDVDHVCLISYNEIGIEAFEAFIKLDCK